MDKKKRNVVIMIMLIIVLPDFEIFSYAVFASFAENLVT